MNLDCSQPQGPYGTYETAQGASRTLTQLLEPEGYQIGPPQLTDKGWIIKVQEPQRDHTREELIETLRWKKFPALSQGYVCLVDVMGSDAEIADAARTSYGKGTRKRSDDETLLRYLMRHRHSTPREMAVLKFQIECPMDLWRQWIRHRMSSTNEYSTRYSEAIDYCDVTEPEGWRRQSDVNKQGSGTNLDAYPPGFTYENGVVRQMDLKTGKELWSLSCETDISTPGKLLSYEERELHKKAQAVYKQRLALGVAREQARKDLPLSNYTRAYWKIDLHNLFHFLGLRMESHAQLEIRTYATIIGEQIVKPLFPMAWQAFVDFQLEAVTFSRLELQLLQLTLAQVNSQGATAGELGHTLQTLTSTAWQPLSDGKMPREGVEFLAKLKKLECLPA